MRMTHDGSAATEVNLYVNDMETPVATDASVGAGNIANTTAFPMYLGRTPAGVGFFKGKIYELMISSVVRHGQILAL